MASLVNALQAEMREAMEEVTEKSLKDADNEMQVLMMVELLIVTIEFIIMRILPIHMVFLDPAML